MLETYDVDELIVTDSDLDAEQLLRLSDEAHRERREGAHRGEDDGAAHAARRVRPRPGRAAVRVAAAGLRGHGLARQARLRPRRQRSSCSSSGCRCGSLIALAVKLSSPGPVFYRDRRVGLGEREFGMLKFRTMVADAAEQQRELERSNEVGGALFKIRDDPRSRASGACCAGSRSTRSRRC